MEKKHYLGYIIAIISGLVILASAFLSFTMTYIGAQLTQGPSVFNELSNFSTMTDSGLKTSLVLYLLALIFAVVEIIYAAIALIFVSKGKVFKVNLLIQRILSCLTFVFAIAMFVTLGLHLSTIESTAYNFNGIGTFVLVLASLVLIEAEFMVRKDVSRRSKDDE